MRTCDAFSGHFNCEFIDGHGGKYHGQFNSVENTVEKGPFKRLWPKTIRATRPDIWPEDLKQGESIGPSSVAE